MVGSIQKTTWFPKESLDNDSNVAPPTTQTLYFASRLSDTPEGSELLVSKNTTDKVFVFAFTPLVNKQEQTITGLVSSVNNVSNSVEHINENTNESINASLTLSPREKVMIKYGGLLNAIKELGGDF